MKRVSSLSESMIQIYLCPIITIIKVRYTHSSRIPKKEKKAFQRRKRVSFIKRKGK